MLYLFYYIFIVYLQCNSMKSFFLLYYNYVYFRRLIVYYVF